MPAEHDLRPRRRRRSTSGPRTGRSSAGSTSPATGSRRGTAILCQPLAARVHRRALHVPHAGRKPGRAGHHGHPLRLRRHRGLGRRPTTTPGGSTPALASIGHAVDSGAGTWATGPSPWSACAWAPSWPPAPRRPADPSPASCCGTRAVRDASSCGSSRPSSDSSTARPGPRTAARSCPATSSRADTGRGAGRARCARLAPLGRRMPSSSTDPTARRAGPSASTRTRVEPHVRGGPGRAHGRRAVPQQGPHGGHRERRTNWLDGVLPTERVAAARARDAGPHLGATPRRHRRH